MDLIDITLAEGMIRIPQQMQEQATAIAFSAMLSDTLTYIRQNAPAAANSFKRWASEKYPFVKFSHAKLNIRPVHKKLDPIDPQEFGRYAKLAKQVEMPTVTVMGKMDGYGEYDVDNNEVVIANRLAQVGPMYCKAYGTKYQQEVLERAAEFLISTKRVIEHELTHYIQFNFLQHGHAKQVDGVDAQDAEHGTPEYYRSQTEFDPQIKSVAGMIESLFSRLKRNNIPYKAGEVISYVIGAGPRPAIDANFFPTEPSSFFAAIRNKPTAWKAATRKLYQLLS